MNKSNQHISLKDVLFLTHPKPLNEAQANLWKKLINNELQTPVTWETQLSASNGQDKRKIWETLLKENQLGALALLRNLRNFKDNNVDVDLIAEALNSMKVDRVLPFRFITAARYYPALESEIEKAMFRSIVNLSKLPGKTVLLIDVSGSMDTKLSDKSDMTRLEAANGLAILARELCENVQIYTFSRELVEVPNRHGFALRDAIVKSQDHRDTFLSQAITKLNKKYDTRNSYDRLIVFSDEQAAQAVPNPLCDKAYMINVATNANGVSYKGHWNHIDGFSEAVFEYLSLFEQEVD